ncbi:MAG: hypothetical protein WC003_09200 [Terrimicrobiaceae bacterium]
MEAILLKLIGQLNSSVFVLVAILAVVLILAYKSGAMMTVFSHHQKKLEKFDGLSDRLIEVKTKVDLIYQNTIPNKVVAASSPIAITPTGLQIAETIKAEDVFEKYVGQLYGIVEKASPQNAYDIQVASMAAAKEKMMSLLDANEINTIKAEAFAKGLLAEDIMAIFGVLLRDHILKAKRIPVTEVDKHAKP